MGEEDFEYDQPDPDEIAERLAEADRAELHELGFDDDLYPHDLERVE